MLFRTANAICEFQQNNHFTIRASLGPKTSLLPQDVFAIVGNKHFVIPELSFHSCQSFPRCYDPSWKDCGSFNFADVVTNFESLALQSTFTTSDITPLSLIDTETQKTIANLHSAQQIEKQNTAAQFGKLENMIVKIMSKMEEKMTLSLPGIHAVSSLTKSDLDDVNFFCS